MAALPSSFFLTVAVGSTYHAAVQLFYKLPGKYRLVRRTHHTHIVEGTHLSYRDLIYPSHGTSEITLRPSTDPDREYEMELMQTTIMNLRTRYGQTATKIEKRAFRIRNGLWSMWAVHTDEGFDVVGWKVADLTLVEVASPKRVGATAAEVVQKAALRGGPWQDGRGANAMAMCVWVGRQLVWQLTHQVDRRVDGVSEVCGDEFWAAVEGEGEGRA